MGSLDRRFATLIERPVGACLLRSGISVEFVWPRKDFSAVCSPPFPPELEILSFLNSPGDHYHYRQPAPRVKLTHPTQSPCLVAHKNFEEWIA